MSKFLGFLVIAAGFLVMIEPFANIASMIGSELYNNFLGFAIMVLGAAVFRIQYGRRF